MKWDDYFVIGTTVLIGSLLSVASTVNYRNFDFLWLAGILALITLLMFLMGFREKRSHDQERLK